MLTPTRISVAPAALRRIETSEAALTEMGLAGRVRVRDQGSDLARIEVDPDRLGLVMARRRDVVAALKAAGFVFVTLDLEGYQQGSHNLTLQRRPVPQPRTRTATDEHDAGRIGIPDTEGGQSHEG